MLCSSSKWFAWVSWLTALDQLSTPRRLERDRFSLDPLPRSSWSSSESCRSTVSRKISTHLFHHIGYISEFEIVDDKRSGKIVVELNGRLNKCGVISPRYDLKIGDFEKFVYHILPSRQFGKVILTTTFGIMDHEEAKRKHIGGKVLGYFYWLRRAAVDVVRHLQLLSPCIRSPTKIWVILFEIMLSHTPSGFLYLVCFL